jgi:hypothetical protein
VKQNLIGQKFNKLTIIEHVAYRRVKCKCDCGTEKECDLYDLKRNRIIGCGCARNTPELRELAKIRAYELQEKGILNIGGGHRLADRYTCYRIFLKRMKNRNKGSKICDISLEDLEEVWVKQNGLCSYTNLPLILATHTNPRKDVPDWNLASIDRIDSSKGYVKDNIQFVSRTINYAKNDMSHEDIIKFLHFIKNEATIPLL